MPSGFTWITQLNQTTDTYKELMIMKNEDLTKALFLNVLSFLKWFFDKDNLATWMWETTAQIAKPCVACYVAGVIASEYITKLNNDLSPHYHRLVLAKLRTH